MPSAPVSTAEQRGNLYVTLQTEAETTFMAFSQAAVATNLVPAMEATVVIPK